ncbi:MAG TPA: alpha/beta hydrolase [Actinomycetospora sp.]|jgi:pimeloyl-ACP methyl ester carboxylesterase|uniref:alpha/beta fold hydrolase n=1 Tax=Actinomycetospora sp. TaxID=1872135 RepID=UPI002F42C1FA
MTEHPTVVLVHGAFADGSSWSAVVADLQAKGYDVIAPQCPLTSLADDVRRLRQALAWRPGPAIVVGHSYGGQVITALGDELAVAGLVYIAAFGLDTGETISGVGAATPPPPALGHIAVDEQGFGRLPVDDFVRHFAADVDPARAKVMHAVQQPVAMTVFDDVMGTPAWRSRPTWYLVATHDQAIDPDEERMFARRMGAETVEVASSHVPMVSHPDAVIDLIEAALTFVATRPSAERAPL